MNVKQMIKRLTEIAAMADGDETEVVLQVDDDGSRAFYDRCCPELVDLKRVRDSSFIPGEHYMAAGNRDRDKDVRKAIVIRTNTVY